MISLMRLLRFLAAWLFWPGVALIAWGELTPHPPQLGGPLDWDKADHFIAYFGLASIGFKFSAFSVAAAALAINVGAYTAEIMRAGFESIPPSQIEAAEGLALSRFQIYWHVILLPAIEKVYPSLTSQFVLLMLASSVTSQISAEELTAVANYVQSDTYRAFETYILVALAYIALSLVLRAAFWGLGQILFPRRRRLGTPL